MNLLQAGLLAQGSQSSSPSRLPSGFWGLLTFYSGGTARDSHPFPYYAGIVSGHLLVDYSVVFTIGIILSTYLLCHVFLNHFLYFFILCLLFSAPLSSKKFFREMNATGSSGCKFNFTCQIELTECLIMGRYSATRESNKTSP
jgi:hypothetical protein